MRNILFAGGLLWLSASSWAGIALDATRIIFSSADDISGQSVGVISSSDSSTPYLIRTQILTTPYSDEGSPPFLVTPSLFRLEPGATNQVRIMKKTSHYHKIKSRFFICGLSLFQPVIKHRQKAKAILVVTFKYQQEVLSNYFIVQHTWQCHNSRRWNR